PAADEAVVVGTFDECAVVDDHDTAVVVEPFDDTGVLARPEDLAFPHPPLLGRPADVDTPPAILPHEAANLFLHPLPVNHVPLCIPVRFRPAGGPLFRLLLSGRGARRLLVSGRLPLFLGLPSPFPQRLLAGLNRSGLAPGRRRRRLLRRLPFLGTLRLPLTAATGRLLRFLAPLGLGFLTPFWLRLLAPLDTPFRLCLLASLDAPFGLCFFTSLRSRFLTSLTPFRLCLLASFRLCLFSPFRLRFLAPFDPAFRLCLLALLRLRFLTS